MSRDLNKLAPTLRDLAKEFLARCSAAGLNVRIIQTSRELEDQAKKYRCTRSFYEIMQKADSLTDRGRPDLAEVLVNVGAQKRPDWLPKGHLTMAACGESKHHMMIIEPFLQPFAYAFDFACYAPDKSYITDGDHPDYKKAGAIAEGLGLEWLGNSKVFKESAHVQMAGLPPTNERLLLVEAPKEA